MSQYKDDGKYTRLGSIHHNMKTRCYNPNYDKYQYYGGKGIKVCDEWRDSYLAFEEWAEANGYRDDLTIDRIDVNGDYTPDNCRWVSRKKQANNKTTNVMITYRGKTQSATEWAEELGVPYTCLKQRLSAGWDVERAFTEPHHNTNKERLITYNGKTQRLHEWAKELGMNFNTLQARLDLRHWPVEKAFTTPVRCRV